MNISGLSRSGNKEEVLQQALHLQRKGKGCCWEATSDSEYTVLWFWLSQSHRCVNNYHSFLKTAPTKSTRTSKHLGQHRRLRHFLIANMMIAILITYVLNPYPQPYTWKPKVQALVTENPSPLIQTACQVRMKANLKT